MAPGSRQDSPFALCYIPGDKLALTLGSDRNLDQISLDQIRRLTDKAAMPLGPVVRIVQKRTGRAGPSPTGEELAHPAGRSESVVRVPQKLRTRATGTKSGGTFREPAIR